MNKVKVFCNRCKNDTNHTIKHEHKFNDIYEFDNDGIKEQHFIGSFSYQIIVCDGCESVSYRSVDFFNQFLDIGADGGLKTIKEKTFETFYPERIHNSIVEKRIANVPFIIKKAYQEVIQCYNYDIKIMCSAGLRAIVEGICNYYSIKGRNLGVKIDGLAVNRLISSELSKALHNHKLLGNYALHRLEVPEKEELKNAIELLELCLETLFGIPQKHSKMKELMMKRSKK